MDDIASNIRNLRHRVPPDVKIVAVSKTKPVSAIMEAYNAGQRLFGENRVQELLQKKDQLPSDISWHLIGHLQSNKVRSVVPFISMIQSVDSRKLLRVINDEAARTGRIIDCLLQIYIAEEETIEGFTADEAAGTLDSEEFRSMRSVRICGVMGMATFTDDEVQVRKEFRFLADSFKWLKDRFFTDDESFREISMGMSGDYTTAIGEGSTMVRIGSLIFGSRSR